MISFENDYNTGAHPKVLQKLLETNLEPQSGYGNDAYCAAAAEKIKDACQCPQAQVRFLVGGTQTNATVITTMLAEYEGVISAVTGHIHAHEAAAVEYAGHKILPLRHTQGKLNAADVRSYIETFYGDEANEHMVFPGMVYISHPTEYGTLYTKQELTDLSEVCRQYHIPLFLDGARLAYGLMSPHTDVTLPDIARLCDVFYIGGTKVGALCGEAVVFTKNNLPAHFTNRIKKRGALLAKGRLLGVQFDALFTDGLYMSISRHAIEMAELMRDIFRAKGYEFFMETTTNQIFITLTDERKAELERDCVLSFWEKPDAHHTVVRFATSWATREEDIRALEAIL